MSYSSGGMMPQVLGSLGTSNSTVGIILRGIRVSSMVGNTKSWVYPDLDFLARKGKMSLINNFITFRESVCGSHHTDRVSWKESVIERCSLAKSQSFWTTVSFFYASHGCLYKTGHLTDLMASDCRRSCPSAGRHGRRWRYHSCRRSACRWKQVFVLFACTSDMHLFFMLCSAKPIGLLPARSTSVRPPTRGSLVDAIASGMRNVLVFGPRNFIYFWQHRAFERKSDLRSRRPAYVAIVAWIGFPVRRACVAHAEGECTDALRRTCATQMPCM